MDAKMYELHRRLVTDLTECYYFVTRDPRVCFGKGKDAEYLSFDLGILDLGPKVFLLGDITSDERPDALLRKIKRFNARRADLLHVDNEMIPTGWDVFLWLFVQEKAAVYIKDRLPIGRAPQIQVLRELANYAEQQ